MRWLMRLVGSLRLWHLLIISAVLGGTFAYVQEAWLRHPHHSEYVKRFERQWQEQWTRKEQQAMQAEQQYRQSESSCADTAVTENNIE